MRTRTAGVIVFLTIAYVSEALAAQLIFPKEPGIHSLRIAEGENRANHFAVSVPPSFDPKIYRPLLVVLHGAGNNGERYIQDWSVELGHDDMVILAPNSKDKDGHWSTSDDSTILNLISKVRAAYQISSSKIFIAGFSSGGWMTWYMGLRYPRMFKAAAVLAGWTEPERIQQAIEDGWRPPAFFIISGNKDKGIPVTIEQIRNLVAQMKKGRMQVRFEEFNGGHVSPIEHLVLVFDWLDSFK